MSRRLASRALSVLALVAVIAYGASTYGAMGGCPVWFALVQIPVGLWFAVSALATVHDHRNRRSSRS